MVLARANAWQLARTRLVFAGEPRLMGIVNVTPDSFSDGGRYLAPDAAVEHGLRLAEAGAAMLDVGGESTRPGSEPVSTDEELRRVIPVVERLAVRAGVPISVDTSKAAVARAALEAGAEAINDISALAGDEAMLRVVADGGCGVCLMHMQGTPRTMQHDPRYADVLADVFAFLRARRDAVVAAGVPAESIALDPGIGFGKTLQHNLVLLAGAARFHELGCPLLYGPSRKRFVAEVLGDSHADRDMGTVGVCLALALRGVQVVRVHHVAAVRDALRLFAASGGLPADKGFSASAREGDAR